LLENKKAQLTLESQAVGSGFIPRHKLKNNFLDYLPSWQKKTRNLFMERYDQITDLS